MKNTTVCVCAVILASVVWAQVKFETFARTSLLTGIGNVEVSSQNLFQGDKKAATQTVKIVGGVVGALAGKPRKQTEITRLDKDLIWDIDHGSKSYSERPIKPLTQEELSGLEAEADTERSVPVSRHRVIKSEFKVEKTGRNRDINGFPSTEYLMTWELEIEDTVSKEKVAQVMTTEMWNTSLTENLKKAQAIEADFNRKLAKKMGLEVSSEQMQQMGLGLLTMIYGLDSREAIRNVEKAAKELTKVEGYPIVTAVTWRVRADSTVRGRAQNEEEESVSSGGLGGMLAGRIAKAIVKEPPKEKSDVLFSSYHEVKSVAIAEMPQTDFEVPDGYKKKQ